jgi:hypothetical protein
VDTFGKFSWSPLEFLFLGEFSWKFFGFIFVDIFDEFTWTLLMNLVDTFFIVMKKVTLFIIIYYLT